MLIDLPPVRGYSMTDCQDLFVSRLDDDFDVNASGVSKSGERLAAPHYSDLLGDALAEPFTYTSSSDSDADMYFSDIEVPTGPPIHERTTELRIQPAMSSSLKDPDQDLALHSPGQLLGTPRDPSRRYEYPFPAHLRVGDADLSDESLSGSSTATTPGLSSGESSSSLGLVSLASPPVGIASLAASLPMCLRDASSPPAPIPVPVPVPVSSSPIAVAAAERTGINPGITSKVSNTLLTPLSQVFPVPGPSSAPVPGINTSSSTIINTTTSIAAHPKLSRFNPADAPVPPGLRSRTRPRKSASVSVPGNQAPQLTAQNMQPIPVMEAVAAATSASWIPIPTKPTSAGSS